VSVSLDKNEVVSVDCTGYLMNHKKRDVPEDIISVETAKQSISEVLTVKNRKTAFIPMNDGSEVFTYEFLCNDKDGNDVLVYINAVTGDEADIKLLLYSDNGTLTR
jgi:germination protein YpeB